MLIRKKTDINFNFLNFTLGRDKRIEKRIEKGIKKKDR